VTIYRCAGPSCPGLPYRASDIYHPASCAVEPAHATQADDAGVGATYTRAQLAAAVDEAHAALRAWESQAGPGHPLHAEVTRALEALHRVGAGLPRVAPQGAPPSA
jgi:hypothetical protein